MHPKLLIIDDNPDFGGHQIMAGYAIEGILEHGNWEILGLIHPENTKNITRWEAIRALSPGFAQRFHIEASPTRSVKLNAVRRYLKPQALKELSARIRAYAPDLILLIQGNIEQGCALFSLVGQLPCPLVSYIPVPHTHTQMGAKFGWLRDLTCRNLYNKPDGFITISDTLGAMLANYGMRGRIQVVQNGISLKRFEHMPSAEAVRSEFRLPEASFMWAQIGRIEYKQKGQHHTLEAFQKRLTTHPDEALVFVGAGPDADALLESIRGMERVFHIPWLNEVATVFPAINGLILPSKYEGVPLVMLEALSNGIPVVGSDRDGMKDWLPDEWRFDPNEVGALLRAMDVAQSADPAICRNLQERVQTTCAMPVFKISFNDALEAWV